MLRGGAVLAVGDEARRRRGSVREAAAGRAMRQRHRRRGAGQRRHRAAGRAQVAALGAGCAVVMRGSAGRVGMGRGMVRGGIGIGIGMVMDRRCAGLARQA